MANKMKMIDNRQMLIEKIMIYDQVNKQEQHCSTTQTGNGIRADCHTLSVGLSYPRMNSIDEAEVSKSIDSSIDPDNKFSNEEVRNLMIQNGLNGSQNQRQKSYQTKSREQATGVGIFGVNIKQRINMNSDLEPLQVNQAPQMNTTTNSRLQSYSRNRSLSRKNSNLLALPILSKKVEKSTVYKQNETLKRSEHSQSKPGSKPKVRIPYAPEIPQAESSHTLGGSVTNAKAGYYANDSPINMRDKYGRRGSSLKKPKAKKAQYRFMIRKQSDDYFSQTPQNEQ